MLGLLTGRSFILREVMPGKHMLYRMQSVYPIEVSGGRNYFVRVGAGSFEQVSEAEGRALIPKLNRVDVPF